MNPKITFACSLYDRMQALHTGEVKPEGVDLEFIPVEWARQIFDRMAGEQAFDMSELSSSEFVARKDAIQCPFVALPVFPSRTFRHNTIWINRKSGIRKPKDLEGKRIGVPLYTMTAAVWQRGHLMDDYGVDFSGVTWVQGAINSSGSHGDPTVLPLLKPVNIEVNHSGKSLSDLLSEGSIDAMIGTNNPESRKTNPDVQRLFPDFKAVEMDLYKRTGVFPIMHLVAIRKEVHEKHPQIAQGLYDAFCASKALGMKRLRHFGALRSMLPWLTAEIDEMDNVFGNDPWPYGVKANMPTLTTLVRYLAEQNIIRAPLPVESLFLPVTESQT
jgi:4,5-dihydroxyphthalate decarboxylase